MTHLEAYRKAGKMDEPKPATDPAAVLAANWHDNPEYQEELAAEIRQAYAPILEWANEAGKVLLERYEGHCQVMHGRKASSDCCQCDHWEDTRQILAKYRTLCPKETGPKS